MKKFLQYTALLLLLLLIGGYFWLMSVNNYKTDGTFELTSNKKPIKIKRDANNIAYVFAENEADLILGQGFVTAQDRLFQIEFYRALIRGELASIVGASMLDSDIKMRVFDISGTAKANFKYLNQKNKDFLQWYCNGYNEYLKVGKEEFPVELGLLGLEPQPLTPTEMLSIIYYIGFNHGRNLDDEILSLNLASRMDNAADLLPLNINPDRKKELSFTDSIPAEIGNRIERELKQLEQSFVTPIKLGSNNWAITGTKSITGKPIVANDPHLDARMLPGVFYPIGLFCPEYKAVGAALPGIPGIMVGRNENVAFGVTNGYGDSQDLYIEKADGATYQEGSEQIPFETRQEIIEVKDGKAIEITIRSTVRGPIISDFEAFGIMTDDVVSLRWSSAASRNESLGVEQFMAAKNVTEFRAALADIDLMYFNFVFGDTEGNIAHQSTGLVPQRRKGAGAVPQVVDGEDTWIGFIPKNELPNMLNPERGWVGTANHDTRPDDYPYYYSAHFSPNYRYARMKEVLSDSKKFDDEALWSLIMDTKNKQAEQLAPIYATVLEKEETTKELGEILKGWDFRDETDAVAPTVYHFIHDELLNLILNDELPDELESAYWGNGYYWSQKMNQVILNKESFIDNINTPEKETLEELIVTAGEQAKARLTNQYGANAEKWTWGKVHTVNFYSPIRRKGFGSGFLGGEILPKSGSNETINRGGYSKGSPTSFETGWFSCFRMVADLNDDEKIKGALSGGSAARILHDGYKSQLEAWKNETWLPYWFTKEKVEKNATSELILE